MKKIIISSCEQWTIEEEERLRSLWPYYTTQELLDMFPGRSIASLANRASRLGLHKHPETIKRGASKKHTILTDMSYEEARQFLFHLHWEKEWPLKKIAEYIGIARAPLMWWFERLGVQWRSISEDNHRRYKFMSSEQIKAQTAAANERMRELMNDPQWKAQHVRKILEAQYYRSSQHEEKFAEALERRGMRFIRQKQFACWFVDFALPEYRLVIEIDGDYWHSRPEQKMKDARKDSWLKAHGWNVLRFWASEIEKDIERCISEVERYMTTVNAHKIAK